MSKVKIFADSTSDLPASWINQHQVGIIPLYVVFDEESLKDGVEITPAVLYQRVEATNKLPKTTSPSPRDFIDAFKPHIELGEDIVYISLSSGISSTYQNALIAASEFPENRVHIVDSLNLCSGIGLLVMKAVRAAELGNSADEIVTLLNTYRPLVETEFVIDTLEYLYKGGRCSGMQNFIGSLLQIRPILKVVEGGIIPTHRIRGKKEKAVQQMLDNALANRELMDKDVIIVAHSFAEDEALRLAAILKEQTGAREVLVTEAGCVISSHCGSQTIGIMYTKRPNPSL